MSDIQYPDGPVLVTYPDGDKIAAMLITDREGQYIDIGASYWTHDTVRERGCTLTPLVPATEPTLEEMIIAIKESTNIFVLRFFDGTNPAWECVVRPNHADRHTLYTADTPTAAVRAGWEQVCKPEAK